MALNTKQKWGIGLLVTSIAGAVAAGFAIGNAEVPGIVNTIISVAIAVLATLGITNVQPPPKPPEEPPA